MGPETQNPSSRGRPGVDPTQTLGSLGEVYRAQDAQKNRMKNASTGAFASEKQRRTEKMAEGITQDGKEDKGRYID